jgi:membrane-bound metal-dependent hydrolase YbcI (DUF457 family)
MKVPEHLALSFLTAQLGVQQQYGPGGTALMMLAGFLPDLDAVTAVAGWDVYRRWHRKLGHGLPMTLLGPAALALLGAFALRLGPFWPLWLWLQIALLGHLVSDILFYRWPVQLLWPLSRRGWQVGLVGWNDLVPTLSLYAGVGLVLALPELAPAAALAGVFGVLAYLAWRRTHPRPRSRWEAWLAGGWARRPRRLVRWLTGDFITR